jgi:transposase
MAMGSRQPTAASLWIDPRSLVKSPGHPFYVLLNRILEENGFDRFVEGHCAKFYKAGGRPSLPPGLYFRLLLLGYFEGIDSERGIAWRVADSISVRDFLGLALTQSGPDHSTISRNRRLIDVETHQEVFTWVLQILAKKKLLRGKTLGVDGTTLEANAAMRSIVRHVDGQTYTDFLTDLAKSSGIENPTREDLARLDRQRDKKTSNDDWKNPHDPDAKITKMKDGQTHLAHKAEHVVDMETGAVLAVTLQPADRGDTSSVAVSLAEAAEVLQAVMSDEVAAAELSDELMAELVADKGYHSNAVLEAHERLGLRSYIAEPKRGKRNWRGKKAAKKAVYGNRRRIKGRRGKALMRARGEKIERSFAHCYETGRLRRTHLRGHENILKRLVVHVAGFNLGLLMRQTLGRGTARGLQGLRSLFLVLFGLILAGTRAIEALGTSPNSTLQLVPLHFRRNGILTSQFRVA